MAYTIGSYSFATKEEAVQHCRSILYASPWDTVIEGEDADFVRSLFELRADKVAEAGPRTAVRFLRKMHRYNTPCFFAELSEGTLLDFSFMKVVNAL